MSCKWLLFLPHHAFCWKATRFNGGLQRGCLPVPHRGLCAVTLGLEGGVRTRLGGLGGRAGTANSVNPPWILAFSSILPPFPLSSSSFLLTTHCFSRLFLSTSLTKLDPRTTGPSPKTGMPQLAYQRLPRRSPDTESRIPKRRSGALFKRPFAFLSVFLCLKSDPQPRTHLLVTPNSFLYQTTKRQVVMEIFQPSHDPSMTV